MKIIEASLEVLGDNGSLVMALLACIAWGTLIVLAELRKRFQEACSEADLIALSLGGWPIPLLAASVLFFVSSIILGFRSAGIATLVLILVVTITSVRSIGPFISWRALAPILAYFGFVFIRIGFVSGVLLPPYFDSAWHYALIRSLLSMEHGSTLRWPLETYYHPGYHLVMAGLASLTAGKLAEIMLLFGQLVLAALPLPIYFAAKQMTGSQMGGVFAAILAGFGWSMPAHAVNWGKYPALLSLLMVEFTAFLLLLGQARNFRAAGALAAQLIHTRAIVLLALTAAGAMLSRVRPHRRACIALLFLAGEIVWTALRPSVSFIWQPYASWVTIITAMLALLAWRYSPHPVFVLLFSMIVSIAAMFMPLSTSLTVLDRPLVQLGFFIPMAVLGGLGAAHLPRQMSIFLSILILVYAFNTQEFLPSPCCQLAGADDVVAIDWLGRHVPKDFRIGIAASDLTVGPIGGSLPNAASDAGAWIAALTERRTLLLSYSVDFSQETTRKLLCNQNISYIYAGKQERSFQIQASQWYELVLELPSARVFRVNGCPYK